MIWALEVLICRRFQGWWIFHLFYVNLSAGTESELGGLTLTGYFLCAWDYAENIQLFQLQFHSPVKKEV